MKNFSHKRTGGQINVMVAVIGSVGVILASVFTSWTTANNRVGQIDAKVQVVEERENNHYLEVSKQLDTINSKLDKLIKIQ